MATCENAHATGIRVVFVGAHKHPSYVVESYQVPRESDLQKGEVLVRMRTATICEDDLKDLKFLSASSGAAREPRVIGHEGIGEVVVSKRPKDGSTCLQPGDRVVFASSDACAKCEMCQGGFLQRCSHIKKYGQVLLNEGSGLHGTFSQHMVIGAGTAIAKVPSNVPDVLASPVNCALARMVHVARSCQHCQKSVAVVQGCSLSGLYLCALLHDAGYKSIYCHDISMNRLRLVQRFQGIPVHVDNKNDDHLQPRHGTADLIVKVNQEVGGIQSGLTMLANGGTYILTATETSGIQTAINWDIIAKKSLIIKGVSGYTGADLEAAVEFLSVKTGVYPFELLFGPSSLLHDFPSAVAVAEKGTYPRVPILNY